MRTAWPTEPLGELCDVQIGRTPPRAEGRFWGTDHAWLSISDMDQGREVATTRESVSQSAVDELRLRLVPSGTVVLSFKLSIGKVGITSAPMYTNEAIAHLPIAVDRIERNYLYWALRSVPLVDGADRAAMGATLNKSKLKSIAIPVPPIEEQRRVAAVLDAADALRAKRRQAIAKLDSLTQAIFTDMFVDSSYRSARLGDCVETTSGGTPSRGRREYFGGGIPWVKSGELQQGLVMGTEETITVDALKNSSAKLMPAGTVLLAMYGATVGESAVLGIDAATNQAVCCLTPNERVGGAFLLGFLRSRRRELVRLAAGGAQPNISQGIIRDLVIPLPSRERQHEYALRVLEVDYMMRRASTSADQLDTLFASLQQRAFRGEL